MEEKPRKEVKRLLESRMKAWKGLRDNPQAVINREVLIKILNAASLGIFRRLKVTKVVIAAETETLPLEDSETMEKAYEAYAKAKPVIEGLGCKIDIILDYELKNGHPVAVLRAIVSNLSQADLKEVRGRHFKERQARVKEEGGPRPRRKKKRGRKRR